MTATTQRRIAAACLMLASVAAMARASAQTYPDRAIHVIVGFAPGSGADIITRHFARKLSEKAGKPVIVDNKPGATSNIALGLAANAKPDGYTLIHSANSNMAGNRFLFKDLSFDTVRDFVPVALMSQTTFLVVVAPGSRLGSIAELTQHLKSGPCAKYAYTNQTSQLASEAFKASAGVTAEPVSYRTAADALPDVQNGTLDFLVIDGTFGLGQIKAGKIKPLAVTTAERLPALPEVPTMQEAGIAGHDFSSWWAAWLPKSTPAEIVSRLEGWYAEITADPETRAFLAPIGGVPLQGGSTAAAAKLQVEIEKWARVTKAAGIAPQSPGATTPDQACFPDHAIGSRPDVRWARLHAPAAAYRAQFRQSVDPLQPC